MDDSNSDTRPLPILSGRTSVWKAAGLKSATFRNTNPNAVPTLHFDAGAGDGARLMMLVLHGDAQREYAYGP
jgi:hypothetical protein